MSSRTNSLRNLRLLIIFAALALAAYGFLNQKVTASVTGPTTTFTGAPDEGNCTACHSDFNVNSGPGSITIAGLPTNYLPNQIVPITVTVNHFDGVLYGFELTATDEQGRMAGTLLNNTMQSAQMQIQEGLVGTNFRNYIMHTQAGVTPVQFHSKSWTFNWRAPATRVGRITLYAAGNGANSDQSPTGDYIYTGLSSTHSNSAPSNFDGDGKTDLAVFRPPVGSWYISRSSNGQFSGQQFGSDGDKPMPGDFDGDGKHDIAVYRPSTGAWYIIQSSNSLFRAEAFGAVGDVPAIGDFDGDGKTDLTVFRPSSGTWYVKRSTNGSFYGVPFGANGDKPVPGDYDADAKSDVAVFRPSDGSWYILLSSNGAFVAQQFGITSDRPVPGDYDSDGKTDIGVYRVATGTWYVQRSLSGFMAQNFGVSTDTPVPGDYDGDGKTDVAVFRDGTWYISQSSNGAFRVEAFGSSGDLPAPAAYIPD